MVEKAVIAAAGLSSRISHLTGGRPKGLLEINGTPILVRSIEALRKNGVNSVSVVVGHRAEEIQRTLDGGITYIANPLYAGTNNLASLGCAEEFVAGAPFLYLHGDVVYDDELISPALEHFEKNGNAIELLTEFGPADREAMKVRVTPDHYLIESNKEIDPGEAAGEWTGIAAIRNSAALFQCIKEILAEGNRLAYDTLAFTRLAKGGLRVYCLSAGGGRWAEVDLPEDYRRAKEKFRC